MKTLGTIKQIISLGFIGSTILFIPATSQTLTVREVTNPKQMNDGWVTDMANILSEDTEAKLNQMIDNLEQNNGTEIVIVTVPRIVAANSSKAFATELFNYWGIGKAELDNGVLFLVSLGDNRVEIETGYGIENILADSEVAEIIQTKITPQYKHENFNRGTIDGTKALTLALQTSETLASSPKIQTSSFLVIFFAILFFCWFIYLCSVVEEENSGNNNQRRKRRNSNSHDYYTDYTNDSCDDSGSFFSSGDSSDGGDFGGGSSDGGGAGDDF